MKKFLITGLLSFILAGSYAQNLKQYTDTAETFSIQYPDTWKQKEEAYGENTIISFELPGTGEQVDHSDAIVALNIQKTDKDITLDALVKPMLDAYKNNKHITLLENKKANGKQTLVFVMKDGKRSMKSKMIVWLHEGMAYMAMYGAPPAKYAALSKQAEAVIKSFTFL